MPEREHALPCAPNCRRGAHDRRCQREGGFLSLLAPLQPLRPLPTLDEIVPPREPHLAVVRGDQDAGEPDHKDAPA